MRTIRYIGAYTALVLLVLPSVVSAASLSSEVKKIFSDTGLDREQQAVCIRDEGGDVVSLNSDMRIIPASVSKLYTFDFALSKLPMDFRYKTTFVVSGKTLYINGGKDAHFVPAHLRAVLEDIKKEQPKLVINRFVFSPDFYFNWVTKPKDVQMALFRAAKATKLSIVAPKISVVIGSAPFKGTGPTYTFESAPLPALVKQINDYSTNVSADALFNYAGGSTAFAAYMEDEYGAGNDEIRFTTGSGLTGNYTTCELTLRVLEHLSDFADKHDISITDLMSVPTIDPGVLSKRVIDAEYAEALVAKSGFVNYHHTLAGAINTKQGLAFFAIFTKYGSLADGSKVKSAIDTFVNKTAGTYERILEPFGYTPDASRFKDVIVTKTV